MVPFSNPSIPALLVIQVCQHYLLFQYSSICFYSSIPAFRYTSIAFLMTFFTFCQTNFYPVKHAEGILRSRVSPGPDPRSNPMIPPQRMRINHNLIRRQALLHRLNNIPRCPKPQTFNFFTPPVEAYRRCRRAVPNEIFTQLNSCK